MSEESLESKFSLIKQYVEFVDIALQYPYDDNLTCKYRFIDYKGQEGDRIAIYKLGWTSVKEYVVFEWAPINDSTENTIIFNKYVLPKSTTEMYQMCYVSSENQMYGISAPFQFGSSQNSSFSSIEFVRSMSESSDSSSMNFEKEVLNLKTENKVLRHSLRDIMEHVLSLQKIMCLQQKEINLLKDARFNVASKKVQNCALETEFDVGELEALPPFPFAK